MLKIHRRPSNITSLRHLSPVRRKFSSAFPHLAGMAFSYSVVNVDLVDPCASRRRVEVIQRLESRSFSHQDVSLDPPRESCFQLISYMNPGRDSKDIVQLFQRTLLRLRNPEEYHT